jgi:hypothetical protein
MVAAGWSDAQKRAYTIADNKLTLNGGWDDELLGLELGELELLGFDLDLIGFTEAEWATLAAQFTMSCPIYRPILLRAKATSGFWDSHRLLCGDSTSREDVQKLLAGVSPHVTDPPCVSYDPAWRKRAPVARFELGDQSGEILPAGQDCSRSARFGRIWRFRTRIPAAWAYICPHAVAVSVRCTPVLRLHRAVDPHPGEARARTCRRARSGRQQQPPKSRASRRTGSSEHL